MDNAYPLQHYLNDNANYIHETLPLVFDLFRRQVQGCADARVILVELLDEFRDAEVANLHLVALGEKDVQRL